VIGLVGVVECMVKEIQGGGRRDSKREGERASNREGERDSTHASEKEYRGKE
jgi:hypothetical protein